MNVVGELFGLSLILKIDPMNSLLRGLHQEAGARVYIHEPDKRPILRVSKSRVRFRYHPQIVKRR